MSAYKSDIHKLMLKLYNNNQAKIVTFYIENVMLITHAIHRVKRGLNIRKTRPMTLASLGIPFIQSDFSLWVLGVVINKRLFSDYIHNNIFGFQNYE